MLSRLGRLIGAARATNTDTVVEATSDCPLIWHEHIDYLIDLHMQSYPEYDLTTNILTRTFPRGFDLRVVNIEALEKSFKEIDNQPDFEHALTWLYLNPKGREKYKVQSWEAPDSQRRPGLEFTLDTESDLELLSWIFSFEAQGYNLELNPVQIINLIDTYPGQYAKVAKVERKDYFQELQEWYAANGAVKTMAYVKDQEWIDTPDNSIKPTKVKKQDEGAKKEDDKSTGKAKAKPGRPRRANK